MSSWKKGFFCLKQNRKSETSVFVCLFSANISILLTVMSSLCYCNRQLLSGLDVKNPI